MVSKIAVIAIVTLVAIPVGLGYAFNLKEVPTENITEGAPTNVSQFLENDTIFTYTNANVYELNGKRFSGIADVGRLYPDYNKTSTAASSIRLFQFNSFWTTGVRGSLDYYQIITNMDPTNYDNQISVTIEEYGTGNRVTFNRVVSLVYDAEGDVNSTNGVVKINYDPRGSTGHSYELRADNGIGTLIWTTTSQYTGIPVVSYSEPVNPNPQYVSIADGFKLHPTGTHTAINYWTCPGSGAEQIVLTFDMSQVSGSISLRTYANTIPVRPLNPVVISNDGNSAKFADFDLVMTPGANVYQLIINRTNMELRYIKDWPGQLGLANYYRSWTYTYTEDPWDLGNLPKNKPLSIDEFITGLAFIPTESGTQPEINKIRIDSAFIKSAPIKVIKNNTYDPATLIGNNSISTTIKTVDMAGSFINFGGNSYTVDSDKNLDLGPRKISIEGITFRSIPNTSGQYDNMINDYVISTTAAPSTIVFNGVWIADIISKPISVEVGTETKWVPGTWAWNGLDVNFALIGLATCAAAFIGFGLYGKRSGSKVGTLMLVCAGGALVFMALL